MSPLFDELVFIEDTEPRDGTLNMAIDELLLKTIASETPILRTYRWLRPTVTIGYFEDAAAARARFGERERLDFVRRWTGGGVVLHKDDFTYALIVPRAHHLSQTRPVDTYRQIHRALAEALVEVGAGDCQLVDKRDSASHSNLCFDVPVISDIVCRGKKISGAGQRRTRHGMLHEGTVQGITIIPPALGSAFAGKLGVSSTSRMLTPDDMERASAIADQRYARAEWLDKESVTGPVQLSV